MTFLLSSPRLKCFPNASFPPSWGWFIVWSGRVTFDPTGWLKPNLMRIFKALKQVCPWWNYILSKKVKDCLQSTDFLLLLTLHPTSLHPTLHPIVYEGCLRLALCHTPEHWIFRWPTVHSYFPHWWGYLELAPLWISIYLCTELGNNLWCYIGSDGISR